MNSAFWDRRNPDGRKGFSVIRLQLYSPAGWSFESNHRGPYTFVVVGHSKVTSFQIDCIETDAPHVWAAKGDGMLIELKRVLRNITGKDVINGATINNVLRVEVEK